MTVHSAKSKPIWTSDDSPNPDQPIPITAREQDQLGLLQVSAKAAFLAAAPGLELVKRRIRSRIISEAPALSEISDYLLRLGGKQIRPLLALLSGRLFGMHVASAELIDAAAGIELIHTATLLHDDIIDEAPKRRNQTSALVKFGMAPTLLTGDFLLTRAFGLCAHLGSFIVSATEEACVELSEGELLEGTLGPGKSLSVEDYVEIVGKKTASLFALAGKVGSHLAGASEHDVAVMGKFGRAAGTAFQMVDDILDISADEDLLGKPAGTDLRQKTPSLVNVLWLQSGDKSAIEFFNKPKPDPESCRAAVTYLKTSDVLTEARFLAKNYASKASSLLSELSKDCSDCETKDHLLALVEYTLERCS